MDGVNWLTVLSQFTTSYLMQLRLNQLKALQTMLHNISIKEGLANVGPKGNEVLTLNKAIFKSELSHLTSLFSEINPLIFRLVHISYERAIKNYARKDLIFYHIHNPDNYAMLNFTRFAPEAN